MRQFGRFIEIDDFTVAGWRDDTAPRITTSDVLLTSVARCAVCGARMKLTYGTSRNGTRYQYYKCSRRVRALVDGKACDSTRRNTIPVADLDKAVLDAVASILSPERVQEIVRLVSERRHAGTEEASQNLKRLKEQLGRLTAAAKRLLDAVMINLVCKDDQFKEIYIETKEQREHVMRLIETEEKLVQDAILPISQMDAEMICTKLRQKLITAPKAQQKRLVRAIVGRVLVDTDTITIGWPEPAIADLADDIRTGRDLSLTPVQSSDRQWWARQGSNL